MSINFDLLKFYPPVNATDPATAGYGGDANTAATMTSGVINNEFDDIQNSERISGLIDYRKQFIKNENTDDWEQVVVYIPENTPSADDIVEICQAGTLSLLGTATLIGTATFETDTRIVFPSSIEWAVRAGEKVFNYTNDPTMSTTKTVATVSGATLTIAEAFGGATAGSHDIWVCPATLFEYTNPASVASGLWVGTIPASTSHGVWKRRTCNASAAGYANNSVQVRWESL